MSTIEILKEIYPILSSSRRRQLAWLALFMFVTGATEIGLATFAGHEQNIGGASPALSDSKRRYSLKLRHYRMILKKACCFLKISIYSHNSSEQSTVATALQPGAFLPATPE